jgi:hypothetical protein
MAEIILSTFEKIHVHNHYHKIHYNNIVCCQET